MIKSVKRAYSAPDLNSKRPKQQQATSNSANTLLNYFQSSKLMNEEAKKSLKKQFSLAEYFKFESKTIEVTTPTANIQLTGLVKAEPLPIIIDDDEDEIDKAIVKAEMMNAQEETLKKTQVNAFELLLKKKEPIKREEGGGKEETTTEWDDEERDVSTNQTTKVFRKCPFYKRIEGKKLSSFRINLN